MMLRRLLPVALFVLAACGDGTGPDGSFSITVQVAELAEPVFEGPVLGGGYEIRCEVTLRAIARGKGAAFWEDAVFRYFAGTDRSEALDTAIVEAGTIQQSWAGARLAAGDTATATWLFTATATFGIEAEFQYQTEDGRERNTKVFFTCGEIPGVEPSVTSIQLADVPAQLEPGDRIDVTYSAAGPAGIVRSTLTLSGPCDVLSAYHESGAPTITRTVTIDLPGHCALGVPLAITVEVLDGALQRVTRTAATATRLVDVTRPTLSASFSTGGGIIPLTGGLWQLFEDEALTIGAEASDNGDLAALVWEIDPAGIRDSVLLSGSNVIRSIALPAGAALETSEIRLRARDRGGLWSDVIVVPAGRISVLPTTPASIRSVDIDGNAVKAAIDDRRGVVYLALRDQRRIAVLSLATMSVVTTIPLSSIPNDLDLLPDGDSLIVTYQPTRAVGLIDLTQPQYPVTEIPLTILDAASCHRPVYVRVAANRKAFISYVGCVPGDRLLELDLATGEQRGVFGDLGAVELERSLDASAVLFTNGRLHRYDAGTGAWTVGATTASPGRPSLDADGSTILHGREVYDATLSQVGAFPFFGHDNGGSVISPDGSTGWFDAYPRGIVRLSVNELALRDRLAGTSEQYRPFGYKRVSSDGSTLVVVSPGEGSSRVTVIIP